MSKIKELKNDTGNIFNLIDALELFSVDKKSKYTDLLLRLMKNTNNISEHVKEMKEDLTIRFDFISQNELDKFSPIQTIILHRFLDSFFNTDDLKSFRRFTELNERGVIAQNDLSKYKSFDELMNQLSLADMRIESKGLENEIIKLLDNEEWLVLRPLTFLSSRKYGSNTKWCTTSEGNPDYFIKYSTKGVLIYCINKMSGYKVASFYSLDKNDPEFSFWNQKDSRIDSLDAEIPDSIRLLIQQTSKDKSAKTNRFLMSDDTRIKEDRLLQSKTYRNSSLSELVDEQPIANRPSRMARIGNAIRRENELMEESEAMEELESMDESPVSPISDSLESLVDRMRLISRRV
jgi:hypothetical protein